MEQLVFTTKDVIYIVGIVISILGTYYAIKRDVEKIKDKTSTMEKSLVKLETDVHDQLKEIRGSQKSNNQIIVDKMELMSKEIMALTKEFAELMGFLKGRDIK